MFTDSRDPRGRKRFYRRWRGENVTSGTQVRDLSRQPLPLSGYNMWGFPVDRHNRREYFKHPRALCYRRLAGFLRLELAGSRRLMQKLAEYVVELLLWNLWNFDL